jgi:hypothetical protein
MSLARVESFRSGLLTELNGFSQEGQLVGNSVNFMTVNALLTQWL